jgi:hypothetical protein
VRISLLDCDGGSDLISDHSCAQLYGAKLVAVHRNAHFAAPGSFD